jgi:Domain of unknown function (DUF4349)
MRIIPFPQREDADREEAWLAELEAALSGTATGPQADSWRELREDVRALAPPPRPELEQELTLRIAATREAHGRRPTPKRREPPRRLRSLRNGLGVPAGRHWPLATAVSVIVVLLAVSLAVRPWKGGSEQSSATVGSTPAVKTTSGAAVATGVPSKSQSRPDLAPAAGLLPQSTSSAGTPGRVQQRGASISLAATLSEVQTVADGVARLAVSVGGFVESSHVQVQQRGSSEAEITLSIPSAKLDATMASLGRLAPVRAESRSLQDITSSYEAARRQLSDAEAGRQALLRALSKASTEGQIDSLRERLSGVGNAISQDRSALEAVSHRAGTSEVEVTVLGDQHASSEGLTVHHALHDAGGVLLLTLTVLLIGAAVLVPIALLGAALLLGGRGLRRYRRERALGRL